MNKFTEIQRNLNAPKNQRNDFGKYNYRSCEDILEAVKPILAKYDYSVIVTDELQVIGERYYIKATAKLLDENLKEIVATTAYAREEEIKKGMDGSQITGSASSYARKYALNGLFAIDDNKDSDFTNNGNKGNTPPEKVKEEEEKPLTYDEAKILKMRDGRTLEELSDMELAKVVKCPNEKFSKAAQIVTSYRFEHAGGELPF